MSLGLNSLNNSCADCLLPYFLGGIGYATHLSKKFSTYLLLDMKFQESLNNSGAFAAEPNIGFIYSGRNEWFKLHLNYTYQKFISGNKAENNIYLFETRFLNNQDWDFRLSYKKYNDEQVIFSLSYYL